MPNRYWLCFDVGLTSSFERLYGWLDDHKALECGDNFATFFHDADFETVAGEISRTTQKDNGRGTRLYLIGKAPSTKDPTKSGLIGRFVAGKRKASPWEGFGSESPESNDEE
jgi:hypothetical protein